MIRPPSNLPRPDAPWVDANGRPTQVFYEYMRALDQAVRDLVAAQNGGA
jgi:hypothetical protein